MRQGSESSRDFRQKQQIFWIMRNCFGYHEKGTLRVVRCIVFISGKLTWIGSGNKCSMANPARRKLSKGDEIFKKVCWKGSVDGGTGGALLCSFRTSKGGVSPSSVNLPWFYKEGKITKSSYEKKSREISKEIHVAAQMYRSGRRI